MARKQNIQQIAENMYAQCNPIGGQFPLIESIRDINKINLPSTNAEYALAAGIKRNLPLHDGKPHMYLTNAIE